MPTETKVSFARVAGAGVQQTAIPTAAPTTVAAAPAAAAAPAQPADAQLVPAQSTAVATPAQPTNSMGFYTGGEEEGGDSDPRDIRHPRLNLVQGMSAAALKAIAPEGGFVLKKSLALPRPFRAVVIGFRPKTWIEKTKFGGTAIPRIARTLEEVIQLGGTDQWKLSRECKDSNDVPVSKLPLFDAHVTAALLIQQPEGFDEGDFPYVSDDNIAFAVALFTLKSTSFGSFYIPLNSERRGLFKGNFASRYVEINSAQTKAWFPTAKILTPTSEAVQKLAAKIVG